MNVLFRLTLASILFGMATNELRAQCCDHYLVMHDTYGDGWNGGHVEVLINGTPIGTFAGAGTSSESTFTVCNGDAVQLVYASGDWEEENTYQLFDHAGNVLFADGPNPAVGTVFSGTADCDAVALPGTVPCAAWPIDTLDCVLVDNSGVVGSGIDPGCASYLNGDLWFKLPVPLSGNVLVSTANTGGLNDTGLALWTGDDCINLDPQGCDDDGGVDAFSQVSAYELPAGSTLYIQVFGYNGATGAFQLCVADLGMVHLDSSELPIVMIDTQGQEITDGVKIDALMQVKYNGPGNLTYVSDPPNEYDGHIGIDIRGATSAGYPQRPYGVETRTVDMQNNDVPILGMPAENDWVLLSNYNDRSLIRDQLAFHLSEGMGQYAPRTHLCEVLIDSVYKGIYVFGEKIKRDDGRVHIAKLTELENSGDDLTGGYILSQNLWGADDSFQSNYSPIDHPGADVHFLYEYPEPEVITPEQKTYIAGYVDSLEMALYGPEFSDPTVGYRRYLDVSSFIDYFLVNEVARSNDGFKKSVYFHKDKASNGGKLKAGPVWDFDWAWKNIYGCSIFEAMDGSGWSHEINDCPTDNYSCGWYMRLLQDSSFANELRCDYEEYRTNVLDTVRIFDYIDSIGSRVQNAQARHFQKWPILGISGPAPEVGAIATTYAGELDTLKTWIARRINWLDANMPGICSVQTGITAHPSATSFTCFPNPTNGLVHVQGTALKEASLLIVRDMLGREVDRVPLTAHALPFDVVLSRSGTYFLSIADGEHVLRVSKVVVL